MKTFIMILSLMLMPVLGFSSINSVASLSNPITNSSFSARAASMGSAFVAVADDSSALYWNPAGLGTLSVQELAYHHDSWLADISQDTVVLGFPSKNLGGFGLSFDYTNYGTFPGYTDIGVKTNDYSANNYGLDLGWGKQFKKFDFGFALKQNTYNIAGMSYSAFAGDIGALWSASDKLRFGVAYTNIGTKVDGYSQASDLRLGSSYTIQSKNNKLLLAADGVIEQQGVNRIQLGAEDTLYSHLALRVGYNLPLAETDLQGLDNLTAGVGIIINNLYFDYAYVPFGDLGVANKISLSYKWGK